MILAIFDNFWRNAATFRRYYDSVVTLHITEGLMSNKTQTTVAPTDAARRMDSRAEPRHDLPMMPHAPSAGPPLSTERLPPELQGFLVLATNRVGLAF
jgi:hypothetical protein